VTALLMALRRAGVEAGLVRVRRRVVARLEASDDGVADERGAEAVVEIVARRGRRAVAFTWTETAIPAPTIVARRVRAALAVTPDLPPSVLDLEAGPTTLTARLENFDTLCRQWRSVLRQALAASPGIVARVEVQLDRLETETLDFEGRTARTTRQEAAVEVAARARRGGRIAFMLAATLPTTAPQNLAPFVRRAIRRAGARARARPSRRGGRSR
jgi:hypothetical protein